MTTLKSLSVWITTNYGKFFKRWAPYLPPEKSVCRSRSKLEPDMAQWTGSQLGKEFVKVVYCHPAYLIYMQSTLCKLPGWMKHKLESRLPGETSITILRFIFSFSITSWQIDVETMETVRDFIFSASKITADGDCSHKLKDHCSLEETQAGIKIAGRNINNLRYADDTTLMAESEEELKSLLMKVKEESEKVGLKLIIQKTKIMASGRITSWQIDGETM